MKKRLRKKWNKQLAEFYALVAMAARVPLDYRKIGRELIKVETMDPS